MGVVEPNGIVLSAHCTCMEGLGEVCSHIAALLFTMEINTKFVNNTSLPCSWLPAMQKVDYAPIEKIDFPAPKRKLTKSSSAPLKIPEPTALYKNLSNAGNPVILSIIPPHSEHFVPQSCSDQLPKFLTNLYDKTLLKVSYPELLTKCEDVFKNQPEHHC